MARWPREIAMRVAAAVLAALVATILVWALTGRSRTPDSRSGAPPSGPPAAEPSNRSTGSAAVAEHRSRSAKPEDPPGKIVVRVLDSRGERALGATSSCERTDARLDSPPASRATPEGFEIGPLVAG